MVTPSNPQAGCVIAKHSSTLTSFGFYCTTADIFSKGATLSFWLFYFKFNETIFFNFCALAEIGLKGYWQVDIESWNYGICTYSQKSGVLNLEQRYSFIMR